MSEWQTIPNLGEVGMAPDQMLQAAAPNAFDLIENFKPNGKQLVLAGGYRQIALAPDTDQMTLFYVPEHGLDEERYLVSAGLSTVYSWDGTTWKNITGDDPTDYYGFRWTGGWLAGVLVLANQTGVRTFDPSQDTTTQPMVFNGGPDGAGDDTWESLGSGARVFRTWRQYCFAGDVWQAGSRYPSRVSWCAAVEPGQRPEDWVARPENDAGSVDLADTPGRVVEMVPMGDYLVIYKTDAIYLCEFIGGNEVFRFRWTGLRRGAAIPWGVAEARGAHYILGVDDIYVFDGSSVQSLILGRLREWWRADRGAHYQRWFVVYDHRHAEVRFHYCAGAAEWPNTALCLHLDNQAWTVRRYAHDVRHQMIAPATDTFIPDVEMYGISDDYLRAFEDTFQQDDNPIPFLIRRKALFSEPGHDWVQVDCVKVAAEGPVMTLNLGDQIAPSAPVTWRGNFLVDPATDYKTDARANGHQIAYRLLGSAAEKLRLSHIAMLVQKSGKRG